MEKEAKRQLKLEEEFTFACHKGLDCYTSCCRDVTIMLTPYDVLRLKKALGLTSGEFLEKYTQLVQVPGKAMPLVQFRMNEEDPEKKCHFVRSHGCLVYAHRPWACRMFPLDEHQGGGFYIVPSQERCHGLAKGDPWMVREWLMDQGATQSKEMDGGYESLIGHEFLQSLDINNPKVQQMLLMALYDLDRFREFVFNSSFLDRFDLDEDTLEAIKLDEVALLDLAYAWVRFGMLGQKTLKLKEGAEKAGGKG